MWSLDAVEMKNERLTEKKCWPIYHINSTKHTHTHRIVENSIIMIGIIYFVLYCILHLT